MLVALLLVIIVLAAFGGWRRGGRVVGLRLAGALGGLLTGLLAARLLSDSLSPVGHVALGALCALGGVILGLSSGRRLARRLGPPGTVDRSLGALLRGTVAAVLAVVVSGFVVGYGPPALASSAAVPGAGRAWSGVAAVLRAGAPADLAALVPASGGADPTAGTIAAVDALAGDRVLRVTAQSCAGGVAATGFVAGSTEGAGLVVTNAHVVLGATSVAADGHPATVVAFDRRSDLAVLRVSGLSTAALPLAAQDAANGAALVVVGYPQDGPRRAVGAVVIARLPTPNPGFGDGAALHEAYRLRTHVEHGNSGSPLLDASGRVVGVVNALAGTAGYAISLDELRPVLAAAAASGPVSTGTCS